LTLAWALTRARRARLRLWLGPEAHRARRRDAWPPGLTDEPGPNALSAVLYTVLVVLGPPPPLVPFLLPGGLVPWPAGPLRTVVLGPLCVGWVVGLAVLILWGNEWVEARVAAAHPLECWGVADPEARVADDGPAR